MIDKTALYNELLSRHTTFRIGGPAQKLIIPESRRELIDLWSLLVRSKAKTFVLGKGSNVLFSDSGFKGVIIKNTKACTEIEICGQKKIKVGSSTPLQKFVEFCVNNGFYGMEYLYSVPGNIGGAICMNAGRGEIHKQSISDFIQEVEISNGMRVISLSREECRFAYRSSIFQKEKRFLIISATFELPEQEIEKGQQAINERMALVREKHDLGYPNAGTVFKRNFRPLPEIIGHRIGDAQFSTKTPGWIINLGAAKAKDVLELIAFARKCHRQRKLPVPELEIRTLSLGHFDNLRSFFRR
jgi:UDP-N-acetylmuramate dehydrogenase